MNCASGELFMKNCKTLRSSHLTGCQPVYTFTLKAFIAEAVSRIPSALYEYRRFVLSDIVASAFRRL